jgi:SAM-dependent methyltransferase
MKNPLARVHWLLTDRGYRHWVGRKLLRATRYDFEQWLRAEQIRAWTDFLTIHSGKDVLEISPGNNTRWRYLSASYASLDYPEFDICKQAGDSQYDIIIADNVFEHLRQPLAAAMNVHRMLKPGGWFMIATPFLIRVHGCPDDYTRWTESGLRILLEESGFTAIATASWGNRSCVKANFTRWAEYGWFRSLRNEPDFPVVVWGFGQRCG